MSWGFFSPSYNCRLLWNRISKGKNRYIGRDWVVNADSPIRRCSQTECYLEWDFEHGAPALGLTTIQNLYVYPDFGKEGLHSEHLHLELHCTQINAFTANIYMKIINGAIQKY